MLDYFLIGAALGAATGVPLGAMGLTVIDNACRRTVRRAVGVGLGGATGDMLWAVLAILGIGPLLATTPAARPLLYALSGAALVAYGALTLRARRTGASSTPCYEPDAPAAAPVRQARSGFVVGVGLVLANPSSLVTWVAIVGMFFGDVGVLEALAAVCGIGIGSAGWYAILASLARRGTRRLGEHAARIQQFAGAGLVGYGMLSLARGARYWLEHGML